MTENIKKESENTDVAATVPHGAKRIPTWWDIVVVLLVFVLSQGAAVALCHRLGFEGPT